MHSLDVAVHKMRQMEDRLPGDPAIHELFCHLESDLIMLRQRLASLEDLLRALQRPPQPTPQAHAADAATGARTHVGGPQDAPHALYRGAR